MTGTIALTISLAGCGSNPIDNAIDSASDQVAENGTEEVIEDLSGGSMDVELDSLPEGFPANVPMVEGDILVATTMTGGLGYTVSITVGGDTATATEQVKADFADWEETSPWNDDLQAGMYDDDDWGVTVSVGDGFTKDTSTVRYGVISRAN
jgi:hypothetical protein